MASAKSTRAPMAHSIERSLQAMTIGLVKDGAAKQERKRQVALDEYELQLLQTVTGSAGTVAASTTFDLDFGMAFYYAPGNRRSELTVPRFSSGTSMESGSGVMIDAHVANWIRDPDTDAVTGATMEVIAVAPGVDAAVPYAATLHLSFQGYTAPPEDDSEVA